MDLFGIALFIHMLGLISLFGSMVVLQSSGVRLRAAKSWQEVRLWLGLMGAVRNMTSAGSMLLLATGLFMAWQRWTFTTPWVVVATVLVVISAILGARMLGPRLERIGRESGRHEGSISDEGRDLLASPALWSPAFAMNGSALGIVWLMTAKPGWIGSIVVPLVLAGLGSYVGLAVARSRPQAAFSSSASSAGTS